MIRFRWMPVLLAVLLGCGALALPAQAAEHEVLVTDNAYKEPVISIRPGDTVVWTATRAGHTVTAADGRFDFHPNRTLAAGERVRWTFPKGGEFRYLCRVHAGMEGLVRVGPPAQRAAPPRPRITVPDDVPTIAAAAAAARPGSEIVVRPGRYAEAVALRVDDVRLRGLGTNPGAVVLDGDRLRPVGITIQGAGVSVENLTVRRYRDAGIRVAQARGSTVASVRLTDNDRYGVDVTGSTGTTLRRLTVTGSAVAGVSMRACAACGALVEQNVLSRNAAGLRAADATGVVVRKNRITGNAAGLVLRDVTGAEITGNSVVNNDASDVRVASVQSSQELTTGAGIWVSGGRGHRITGNTMTGHTYDIAVTGPQPVFDVQVLGNVVSKGQYADLGWDGLGTDVCFSGNRRPDRSEPTSGPPMAQAIYSCDRPASLGLPYPVVLAHLLAQGARLP